MKLAGKQLVLDTNILLHLLRGRKAAEFIEREYGISARIDLSGVTLGVKMGKNDLWIAATTLVVGGVLLTTDADFDHLAPTGVEVERILEDQLK